MEHFRYHAWAMGLAARIDEPFHEVLPVRSSLSLSESGGFGNVRVENVRFRDIISAKSVTAVVAGSYSKKDATYDSLATTVIEDLDVLGVVKAERITARIAAIHPESGGPPSITPLGSHFEDLRIAGHRVRVDLAIDTFSRLDTAQKVREAYRNNEDDFRNEFDGLSLLGRGAQLPDRLQRYFPWRHEKAAESIPERNGEIHCGLVREVAGLGSELVPHGNTIYVRGFGVIRLAEFSIADTFRSLTMLQIDLGSTPSGHVSSGGVGGNGSDW